MLSTKANRVVSALLCIVFLLAFVVSANPLNAFAIEELDTTIESVSDESSDNDESYIPAEAGGIKIDPDAVADEPTNYESVSNTDSYVSQTTGERVINGIGELSGIAYQPNGVTWDGDANPIVVDGEEFFRYDIEGLADNPQNIQMLLNCDPMKAEAVPENKEYESEEELLKAVAETEEKITEVMLETGVLVEKEETPNLLETLTEAIFPKAEAGTSPLYNNYTHEWSQADVAGTGVTYVCTTERYNNGDNSFITGEYLKYLVIGKSPLENIYPAFCMDPENDTSRTEAGRFIDAKIINNSKVTSDSVENFQSLARICYYGERYCLTYGGTTMTDEKRLHMRAAAEILAYNIKLTSTGARLCSGDPDSAEMTRLRYSKEIFYKVDSNGRSYSYKLYEYCKNKYNGTDPDGLEFEMILLTPENASKYQRIVGVYCINKIQLHLEKRYGDTSRKGIPNVQFKLECLDTSAGFPSVVLTTDSEGNTDYTIPSKYAGKKFRITEIYCPPPIVLDETDKVQEFTAQKVSNLKAIYAHSYQFKQNEGGYIHVYKTGDGKLNKWTQVTSDGSTWEGTLTTGGLAGAKFKITAASPINDAYGKQEFAVGEVVEIITTDGEGHAQSKWLMGGSYDVTEIEAPEGYINSGQSERVHLTQDVILSDKPYVFAWTPADPLHNQAITGSLKITKTNQSGKVLAGAVFGIYDSSMKLLFKATTNSNGVISVTNMPPGTYYYKELTAPSGYTIDDPDEKKFTIGSSTTNSAVSVTVKNTEKTDTGYIELYKTGDKFSSSYTKVSDAEYKGSWTTANLANAVFTVTAAADITGSDGSTIYKSGATVTTLTTNSSGYAKSEELPVGSYNVKETSAPSGYINSGASAKVTVTKDATAKAWEKASPLNNEVAKGSFKIVKVSSDNTSKKLSGAKFKIMDSSKTEICTLTTDSNGEVRMTNLPAGTYYAKETSAPSGYELDSTEFSIKLTESGGTIPPVEITRKNTPSMYYGKIDLYKIGKTSLGTFSKVSDSEYKGNWSTPGLSGVTFSVTAAEKIVDEAGNTLYAKGASVTTMNTDSTGYAITGDVPVGEYTVTEKSAPTGYINAGASAKVTVTKDATAQAWTKAAALDNNRVSASLIIKKVDSANESKVLAGAKIKIMDSNKTEICTLTTDANGKVYLTDVPGGKYYYQEVESPVGYDLDTTVYGVTLAEGSTTEPIHVSSVNLGNDLTKIPIEVVKKDANTSSPLAGAEFTLYKSDKKTVVQTVTTGSDGKAVFDELTPDTYYMKETKVPAGYVLDSSWIECYVDFSAVRDPKNPKITKEITNEPIMGSVTLKKIADDPDNYKIVGDEVVMEKKKAEGVEFKLVAAANIETYAGSGVYRAKTGDTIAKGKTDKDGKLVISNYYYRKPAFTGDACDLTTQTSNIDKQTQAYLGSYQLIETKTYEHYLLADPITDVKLTEKAPDWGTDYTCDNYIVTRPFEFTKTDIVTSEPLPGATIRLYDSNKTLFWEQTTKSNGKIDLDGLPAGTYYYQEIAAPDGFLIDTGLYEFVIDENSEAVIKAEIQDKPVYGEIKIKKYGEDPTISKMKISDSGDISYEMIPLAGARFALIADEDIKLFDAAQQVFAQKGDIVAYFTTNDKGEGIIEGKGYYYRSIGSTLSSGTDLTTSKSGTMTFEHAILGSYHLEEVTVPEGYRKCLNQIVTLTDDHSGAEIMYSTVEFENILETGHLEITKVDTHSQMPVEGAVVTILNENQEVVTTGTTDKNGKIKFTRLPVGTYFYYESQAPEGYELDKTLHQFEIKLDTTTKCNFTDDTIYELPGAGMSDNILLIVMISFVVVVMVGQGIFVLTRKKS